METIGVVEWLLEYGYIVLFPLLIIDGTAFGFLAGVLAGAGVFNPFIVFALWLAAKAIGDPFVYYSARHGAAYIEKLPYAKNIISSLRNNNETDEGRGLISLLKNHFVKLMIIAKTFPIPSLSTALYISGGVLRLPPRRVFLGPMIVQPFVSAAVIALGFFFGGVIQSPQRLLTMAGVVVLLFMTFFVVYSKYLKPFLYRSYLHGVFREWFKKSS
jgi:membrane protein DedA with SNARE-associated domain